jgi:Double-GTPase 2
MTPDKLRNNGGRTARSGDLVAQVAIAVIATTLIGGLAAAAQAAGTKALIDVGFGLLAALYIAGVALVMRNILRTRYFRFRMALTGQPAAGKTVFANLLYDQLMNSDHTGYEFTAESKSAIATYQAIRGIAQDEWPPTTTRGTVLQRDGVLRGRRSIIDLEIGDSAGEHWLHLATASTGDESDYLQWVLSAQALVHVIPANRIFAEGFEAGLRVDIEDLRLAVQLMRNVSHGRHAPASILVVFSKVDLIKGWDETDDLLRIFRARDAGSLSTTTQLATSSGVNLGELLLSLERELNAEFRSVEFTYSSTRALQRALGRPRQSDVPDWIARNATFPRAAILRPIFGRRERT